MISLGFPSGDLNLDYSFAIKVGTDGPYISASYRPTLFPNFYKANAKLIATVDFPTPPLQLETAMILFTFASPYFLSNVETFVSFFFIIFGF